MVLILNLITISSKKRKTCKHRFGTRMTTFKIIKVFKKSWMDKRTKWVIQLVFSVH